MQLIVTVLLLLLASPAGAVDIALTSGSIVWFQGDTSIKLFGPEFALESVDRHAEFVFTAGSDRNPNTHLPALYPTGTPLDFNGFASLFADGGFVYDSNFYFAGGQLITVTVNGLVLPRRFTLEADLHGIDPNGGPGLDVTLTGAGLMTAFFGGDSPDRLFLNSVAFTIVPEPALSWLLVASALGLTLMPRSAKRRP